MSGTINQNELIISLNKIKSYIDNNTVELKVEDNCIYYKAIAENEWTILISATDGPLLEMNNKINDLEDTMSGLTNRLLTLGNKINDLEDALLGLINRLQ